jgi:D-alanine-D-alanine ligase-like ATP-grasp enzyme
MSDKFVDEEDNFEVEIVSSEIVFYKKQENGCELELPSYSVILNTEIDKKPVVFMRSSFFRNEAGQVPLINRKLLEHAAVALEGFRLKADILLLDGKIRKKVEELHEELYRKVKTLDLLSKEYLQNKTKEEIRRSISNRIRKFTAAFLDIVKYMPVIKSRSGNDSLTIVDGAVSEQSKTRYLAGLFQYIEDFKSVPLPEKPVVHGKLIREYPEFDQVSLLKKNGTKGYLFYYYALGYGLSTQRLTKFSLVAKDKHNQTMLFSWSTSQLSSIAAHALCVNKEVTRHLLLNSGLPVPQGRAFPPGAISAAISFAELIGYPVVSKPLNGSKGDGVVVNISNREELLIALKVLDRSIYKDSDFIIEKFVQGKDYRIVVVGGEVKGALCRELASVCGDGKHTTLELMLFKHAWRMRNPHFIDRTAFIDEESAFGNINNHSVDLLRKPAEGEQVVFGTSCNISQGADSVDVLDELHPTIKDAAIRAVRTIPALRYCGVDMLLEDHSRPLADQSAAIIELNAKAAIGNCEYPMFGTSREVVKNIFTTVAGDFNLSLDHFNGDYREVVCEVRGNLKGGKYLRWLNRVCKELSVEKETISRARRKIIIKIQGNLTSVAMIATRMIVGPAGTRPTSVIIMQGEGQALPDNEGSMEHKLKKGFLQAGMITMLRQLIGNQVINKLKKRSWTALNRR